MKTISRFRFGVILDRLDELTKQVNSLGRGKIHHPPAIMGKMGAVVGSSRSPMVVFAIILTIVVLFVISYIFYLSFTWAKPFAWSSRETYIPSEYQSERGRARRLEYAARLYNSRLSGRWEGGDYYAFWDTGEIPEDSELGIFAQDVLDNGKPYGVYIIKD